MPNPAKIELVNELKELLKNNNVLIVADHSGLNVAQISQLRRKLGESGSVMRVAKNRLIQIARAEVGLAPIDQVLEGPTSLILSKNDPVPSAKTLKVFIDDIAKPQIKAVIIDDRLYDVSRFDEIATMPGIDQLRAMFLGAIASPITGLAVSLSGVYRGLAIALNRVAEQKQAS